MRQCNHCRCHAATHVARHANSEVPQEVCATCARDLRLWGWVATLREEATLLVAPTKLPPVVQEQLDRFADCIGDLEAEVQRLTEQLAGQAQNFEAEVLRVIAAANVRVTSEQRIW